MESNLNTHIKKKKCLVTGATRGIGKRLVYRLLENGMQVIATGSSDENLKKLSKELNSYDKDLYTFKADLSLPKEVQLLCENISQEIGDIDIIINNAGILYLENIENSSDHLLRKSFEVNFFAPFAISRYFIPQMKERKSGVIINMCSSSSYTGGGAPGHTIYASTKHALLGLTRALDEEIREHNIRIGSVSPAGVSTEMMMERGDLDHSTFMTADEVAEAVMFLINNEGQGIVYEMRMWRKDR